MILYPFRDDGVILAQEMMVVNTFDAIFEILCVLPDKMCNDCAKTTKMVTLNAKTAWNRSVFRRKKPLPGSHPTSVLYRAALQSACRRSRQSGAEPRKQRRRIRIKVRILREYMHPSTPRRRKKFL